MTPLHRAWTDGVIQGLREYAWMEGDIQYVGKPHTYECRPLEDAIDLAESVWAHETLSEVHPAKCLQCGKAITPSKDKWKLCHRCLFLQEVQK